ncbi:MAG: S8 family serine peptidase, partial [Actinomycetota bacterium]
MRLPRARVRRILAFSVAAALLTTFPGPGASAADTRAFVDPNLLIQEGVTSGLVHVRAGAGMASGIAAAKAGGLVVGSRYEAIEVFAAAGPADGFRRLAQSAAVELVESDQPIEVFTDTAHRATRGQDVLDGQVNGTPFDGTGVGVAVVDSGVDGTHPDLVDRMGGNVRMVCPTTQAGAATFFTPFRECIGPRAAVPLADTDTVSLGGHGTHVAGIIAGDGTASEGRYHGSAPGATIFGVSAGAFLSMTDALDGLAWVLENHDNVSPPIRVVNNSWGTQAGDYCGSEEDPCDEDELPPFGPTEGRFHRAIWKLQEELVAAGVTVVMAAGNAYGTGYAPTT